MGAGPLVAQCRRHRRRGSALLIVTERSIAIFAQEADHPSARIASNRVMHAKDDDRSPVRRNIYTIIGELVGTAGLGGDGFNAVHRNVRFAPQAVIP